MLGMQRVRLTPEPSIDERLAAIRLKKQALAQAALSADKDALQQLEKLDAEAARLQRDLELTALAAEEAKKQAAEQAAREAREEREQREAAATKLSSEVLYLDDRIDGLLEQLARALSDRRETIRSLAATKVVSNFATNRMQQRFSPTAAADFFGLRPFISIEPILPAHRRSLSASDGWLAKKPLTAATDTNDSADDDEAEQQRTNGASNV
jgi:hypothetical protein